MVTQNGVEHLFSSIYVGNLEFKKKMHLELVFWQFQVSDPTGLRELWNILLPIVSDQKRLQLKSRFVPFGSTRMYRCTVLFIQLIFKSNRK